MQSPSPDPALDGTPDSPPASTAQEAQSPIADEHLEYLDDDADPAAALVAQAAERVANALNDLKRALDDRDGTSAGASGKLVLTLNGGASWSRSYALCIVPSEEGDEFPVRVEATLQKRRSKTNGEAPVLANGAATTAPTASMPKPTRRDSDAELEKDLVSQKRRRLEGGDGSANKRMRTDGDEDIMPFITKEDMEGIFSRLREDIQEDTTECVNHVQKVLRRFKEEWHEKCQWDLEHRSRPSRALRNSEVGTATTPDASFPSPDVDRDDQDITIPDLIRKESKLIGSQIRWVEECRRVAADLHDKREENWRTTSAGFHDQARQDRESFQSKMLHESGLHTQTLNQILNEVKTIGLYTQSMKWETPASLNVGSAYHQAPPVVPSFPAQAKPTMQNMSTTQPGPATQPRPTVQPGPTNQTWHTTATRGRGKGRGK